MLQYSVLLFTIFHNLTECGRDFEMMQTTAVRGQVKCNKKNVANTAVMLGIDIRLGLFLQYTFRM